MRRLLLLALLTLNALNAQTVPPTFEVATVKPNRYGSGNSSSNTSQGRITIQNETLKQLIERAFDVRDFSLEGPNWLETERFDVVAKTPEGAPESELSPMLQNLLKERFKITSHIEKKLVNGYALIPAKGGPKVEEVKNPESNSTSSGRAMLSMTGLPMARFADMLARTLDQPVQDLTGLKGTYKLKLKWSPDSSPSETASDSQSGPSIFTALQEQLGLKLRSQKVLIDVLVIDSAEKVPTEN